MANIEVDILNEEDLTVFTVEGSLTSEEIINYSSQYYIKHPTKNVLWDANNATLLGISTKEFQNIAKHMRALTVNRKGGKTAFVKDSNAEYGLGRMYESFAVLEDLPVTYRVFHKIDDAKDWLSGS